MSGKTGTIQPYVQIGTQKWQRRNLDVSTYRNGDIIPYVKDSTQWQNLTTGAWCWYNNDPELGKIYGKLYNGYAVRDNRGLAPEGWSIPTSADWTALASYINGNSNTLKVIGTTYWTSDSGATNSTKFTALGTGVRDPTFNNLKNLGYWWTSTYNSSTATLTYRVITHNTTAITGFSLGSLKYGLSIRCIKD